MCIIEADDITTDANSVQTDDLIILTHFKQNVAYFEPFAFSFASLISGGEHHFLQLLQAGDSFLILPFDRLQI